MAQNARAKRIAGYDYNPAGGKTGKQQAAKGKRISPANKARIAKSTSKILRKKK
jgi:hypothetical protein